MGDLSKFEGLPLLRKSKSVNNVLIVLIATSRGFTGSLNSNLTVHLNNFIKDLKVKNSSIKIEGLSLYKYGLKIFNRLGINVISHYGDLKEGVSTYELIPVFEEVEKKFVDSTYDEVYVFYPKFINTLIQKPTFERVLPVGIEKLESKTSNSNLIFEPSKEEVLNLLVKEYFQASIYNAVLQTNASEFAARFVAMKNATDNAKELQDELKLFYNRARQSQVTQEIAEITSGAMALST
jgi:F-type H+-transporting ATPase subunit gamma